MPLAGATEFRRLYSNTMARTFRRLPRGRRWLAFVCVCRATILVRAATSRRTALDVRARLVGLIHVPYLILYALWVWRRPHMLLRHYWLNHELPGSRASWQCAVWTLERTHASRSGFPALTMCELMALDQKDLGAAYPGGHNLLTLAAKVGQLDVVHALVQRGCPLEHSTDLDSLTHFSRRSLLLLEQSQQTVAEPLPDGSTAVVHAWEQGHVGIAHFLLAKGAQRRSTTLREESRRLLRWELVRSRALFGRGRCSIADGRCSSREKRLRHALGVVSGKFGHCPDGPFHVILAHL